MKFFETATPAHHRHEYDLANYVKQQNDKTHHAIVETNNKMAELLKESYAHMMRHKQDTPDYYFLRWRLRELLKNVGAL